ncbi:uncharacterized protein LOC134252577, partial [Saccostrea cucullata]|uniref:uncharacterized protein LOC134252577 n=1 Tax=Saccostrea cuccullata TaxID=36930 RepID=UPI002ED38A2B
AGKEKRTGSDFSDDTIKLNFNLAQQQHGEKQTTVPYDVESFMHKKYIETKLITSKCEEEIKIGKISGRTPLQTKQTELSSFSKKLEQLRKTGEASMRIKKLIDSLNIEQTYSQKYQRGQRKTNEYEDIIKGVDYLDCSDFDLSSDEKQLQGSEPFLQVYFDEDLGWMINCAEVFRKVQSAKCRYILSILFAAHIKEQISEFQPKNIPLIIDCCMDYAIKNENHIFILELVRRYIFAFDFNLQTRFEGRKINSVVIETLLQAAKCMILNTCPRLRQNAISLSFCYESSPGGRLVMMMSYRGIIEMKDGIPEKAMGVKLVLYNYTQPSDEAYTVFNSFMASSAINLPLIAEKEARKLFKKHSNLTLISASPFKSTGYLTGKHRVVEKLCISLLCLHKGFIPIGEKEFPKVINGHDVDVQEGYCSLGSGRSIDFGGHIRRARGINTPGHGSIGGFVDLPNNAVGLITCAHVVFSSDELIIPNSEMHNIVLGKGIDLNVEFFDKNQHNFQVCGTIIDKCFPLSSNNNSVDAALIKLDPTVNEFGFPVTDQLYSAGFDPNYPPIFSGEVVNVPDPDPVFKVSNRIPDKSDSVVKYGSKTKFTIGNLYFNGAHIRFVDDTGYLPDKTIAVMCNQIEIQSLPHGTFFEPGDSGAFVFCINPDKTLSCIGMAIGSTTKGSCFVTPMTRILDSFGRPHRLKPCSPLTSVNTSTVSDNPLSSELASQSNATSDINLGEILLKLQTSITGMQSSISDVQNQQRNIQSSLQSMQTDVGNLKTEVGNLKTEVQAEFGNLRTDVQREVGNLRMEVQVENENLRTQVQTEVGYLKTQVQEIKEEFQIRSTGSSPDINQN